MLSRFLIPSILTGKRVLLVDDIITTGATASEAAHKLLQAGVLAVVVLTLASGVMDNAGASQSNF